MSEWPPLRRLSQHHPSLSWAWDRWLEGTLQDCPRQGSKLTTGGARNAHAIQPKCPCRLHHLQCSLPLSRVQQNLSGIPAVVASSVRVALRVVVATNKAMMYECRSQETTGNPHADCCMASSMDVCRRHLSLSQQCQPVWRLAASTSVRSAILQGRWWQACYPQTMSIHHIRSHCACGMPGRPALTWNNPTHPPS